MDLSFLVGTHMVVIAEKPKWPFLPGVKVSKETVVLRRWG